MASGERALLRHTASATREKPNRIGSGPLVMWVNVFLPHNPARQAAWNAALNEAAGARAGELTIFDWATIAAQHPTWLAGDHIHYNTARYEARSVAVASGLASAVINEGGTASAAGVGRRVVRF